MKALARFLEKNIQRSVGRNADPENGTQRYTSNLLNPPAISQSARREALTLYQKKSDTFFLVLQVPARD
jgi:hypothetical protein